MVAHGLRALPHEWFNYGSAPPGYPRRTHSRGHVVPNVVLVEKQDTVSWCHLADLLVQCADETILLRFVT